MPTIASVPVRSEEVAAVRSFNRYYTRQIGLLNEGIFKSEYSLTESRVLYELANRSTVTANFLAQHLTIDEGYLSRLLKKFESRGLIERTASNLDGRQSLLRLTKAGREVFEPLNQSSQNQINDLLAPLATADRARLVQAMQTIEEIMGGRVKAQSPVIFRSPRVGDMGWIIHRQGVLYAQEYGWDETFEALVAEIAGAFVKNFDFRNECCWIAERDGEIMGSVFLVRESNEVAKLRLLYVEPSARGLGIGRKLVDECIRFARAKGYKVLTLWTNNILGSARRIYESAGFTLVEEEPHHSFGKDLIGQNWNLEL